jgi:acetyl-CoA carboxylase biotin carboxyl carrier protein
MKLVEQSSFDELTLEMDGIKLTLRRGGGVVANGAGEALPQVSPAPEVKPAPVAAPVVSSAPSDPNVKDVPAPLLGTFYRAPKPGAPPFVEVGAAVGEDTVVGIIEVMKLKNTVRAGVRGTVTEILARDATLVEYGETLLRVRKAG